MSDRSNTDDSGRAEGTQNDEGDQSQKGSLYDAKQQERYISQLQEEKQAALKQVATLEAKQELQDSQREQERAPENDWTQYFQLDEDETAKALVDPNVPLQKLQTAFFRMGSAMNQELAAVRKEMKQNSPEMASIKPEIETLRQNPALANLDDDVLAKFVESGLTKKDDKKENTQGKFPNTGPTPQPRGKKFTKANYPEVWNKIKTMCEGTNVDPEKHWERLAKREVEGR